MFVQFLSPHIFFSPRDCHWMTRLSLLLHLFCSGHTRAYRNFYFRASFRLLLFLTLSHVLCHFGYMYVWCNYTGNQRSNRFFLPNDIVFFVVARNKMVELTCGHNKNGEAPRDLFHRRKKNWKRCKRRHIIVIIIKKTREKRLKKGTISMELSFLLFRIQLSYLIVKSCFCISFLGEIVNKHVRIHVIRWNNPFSILQLA